MSLLFAQGDWFSITDIRLWDAASGARIASIPVDTTYTISLSWSPDSSTIATGGWDGSIKLVENPAEEMVDSGLSIASANGESCPFLSFGWPISEIGDVAKTEGQRRAIWVQSIPLPQDSLGLVHALLLSRLTL